MRYEFLIEKVRFDEDHLVLVADVPALVKALPPLPPEEALNRAGLPRCRVISNPTPLGLGKATKFFLHEYEQHDSTQIRFVWPLPELTQELWKRLLSLYSGAIDELQEGYTPPQPVVCIFGANDRQEEAFAMLRQSAEKSREIRDLVRLGMTWDGTLGEDRLRRLDDPLPYLEAMRPYFEDGQGDYTSESGYPKKRNYDDMMERNKKGLSSLADLPQWREAFAEFERRHGYSACPRDWGWWGQKRRWPIAQRKSPFG